MNASLVPRNAILLTKTTAAQTEDALSYYRVHWLCFLPVVFVATIYGWLKVLEYFPTQLPLYCCTK